ncbi:recombinase family protein [Curtobacterium sp. VKM Ac-1393]|uniref:recombinase family protein n=1 Tax=Curtobacterium sp. VKM Ac-1393 TaxID=2783814 RepID=UPI00188BE6D5|nr:recombinase family protein [Curtobacterium sp. VKM Ac-1393]MBF4606442.1 recombinase family protein [Curtobacterium sp. VKM Ac-1393]
MTAYRLDYARVSTVNQRNDNQLDQLRGAGCTELFSDHAVSGSKNHERKEYRALFERVRELRVQGHEVTVCVVKFDRFSRSLQALLTGVEELGQLGASFTALADSFTYDANSPMSRPMLQMLGALAEFERSLVTSRMSEGMEAKVAKGLRSRSEAQAEASRGQRDPFRLRPESHLGSGPVRALDSWQARQRLGSVPFHHRPGPGATRLREAVLLTR